MAVLYDAQGNLIYPNAPLGSYLCNLNIRHIAADASGSAVFAMTNPTGSGRTVFIKGVKGRVFFDGTAVAATSLAYDFIRYSGNANPTTGTTVPRIKRRSTYTNSVIADTNIQQKSGILTLTGAVMEAGPLSVIRAPIAVTNVVVPFELDFVTAGVQYEYFELQAGEGLAIRLATAAVIGLGFSGRVEWDEKA